MKIFWIVMVILVLAMSTLNAEVIFNPTTTIASNGDTIQTVVDVDVSGTITITQSSISTSPYKQWIITTEISPDINDDGLPEISIVKTDPSEYEIYDVNRDGVIDGSDLWTLINFLYFTKVW